MRTFKQLSKLLISFIIFLCVENLAAQTESLSQKLSKNDPNVSMRLAYGGLNLRSYFDVLYKADPQNNFPLKKKENNYPKVFVLWASWCTVCKKIIPEYLSAIQNLKNCKIDTVFIAMNDQVQAANEGVKFYLKDTPTAHDKKDFLKKTLDINSVPTFVVTDANEKIITLKSGRAAKLFSKEIPDIFKGKNCVQN